MRLERRQLGRPAPAQSLSGLARLALVVLVLGLLAGCGGGGGGSGSVPFSGAPPPPSITTTALDDGVNTQAYSVDINASGGTLPLTWRETTAFFDDTTGVGVGNCAGLTLDLSATGRTTTISGTPTTTGTCGPFTIEIEDSAVPSRTDTQDLSIAIFDPLTITTTSLPNGTDNVVYTGGTITATGGNGPSFSWSISAGSLPPGLGLSGSTTASEDITGTPTTGGSFNFTVQVTDSASPAQSDTQAFNVLVLEITTTGIPDAVAGEAYSGALSVAGEVPTVTWTDNATLPANFSINSSTGEITGNPDAGDIGNHNLSVSVTDSDSPPRTDSQALVLTVVADLVITTGSLPNGTETLAYNETINAIGGTAPYTWSEPTAFFSDTTGAGAIGTACEGLTLDLTATGLSTTISGTPPNDGDCGPFTVRIDDAGSPGQFDEQQLTITIAVGPVTILTTSLPDGAVSSAYSASINATGGVEPYTWSETTAFFDDPSGQGAVATACEGLTLDLTATSSPTTITDTPVNEGTCGPFDITVTDSQGVPDNDTQSLSITVIAAPLGRNDTIADATALTTAGNLTITASISPYSEPVAGPADPDEDFYELTATAGSVVTVEITARRLPSPSVLDSVIEIVDSLGTRFTTCRPLGGVGAFNQPCVNDDISLGVILDSALEFEVPVGGPTFFIRVLDFRGDARPDMLYELRIQGAD